MVGQHDAGRADPDPDGVRADVRGEHLRRAARQAGHVVVLGHPVTPVPGRLTAWAMPHRAGDRGARRSRRTRSRRSPAPPAEATPPLHPSSRNRAVPAALPRPGRAGSVRNGEADPARRPVGSPAWTPQGRTTARANGGTVRPYEVRPIGWVSSPLTDPAQAPRQGHLGAPPAWLVFGAQVAEGIRDLQVGEHIIVLSWLDRARRDELSTIPERHPGQPPRGFSAPAHPTGPTRSASTASRYSPSTACASWSAISKHSTGPRSSMSNQSSARRPSGYASPWPHLRATRR